MEEQARSSAAFSSETSCDATFINASHKRRERRTLIAPKHKGKHSVGGIKMKEEAESKRFSLAEEN